MSVAAGVSDAAIAVRDKLRGKIGDEGEAILAWKSSRMG